ncbi:MAG: winged helix-turn-helix transcriptional regulator [Phycisphaerales bacterium]|nr:MAG: winged helix-turn-helix transcriptional regulator [Phycisphaerales bacterium]
MAENLPQLLRLFHHRWSVPVLARLHREGGGAKFITLVNRLGVSRDALRRTLAALIEQGWVMRNPGYGHPLRPEYILTPGGRRLAPVCNRLMVALQRLGAEGAGLRKWSLVVMGAVAGGCRRFSEIRAALPGVTARALALTLKQLQDAGLQDRVVYDDYPPCVEYRPSPPSRRLSRLLDELEAVI